MKSNKRIAIVAIVMALVLLATACSFSVSTANIQDAIMTDSIDAEGKPGATVTSYSPDAPMLYVSAKVMNAPDNTQIKFVWTYVTGNELIDEITVDSGNISDRYVYSNLEPTAQLPEGDYMVQIFIDERKEPDATVNFTVSADVAILTPSFTVYSQTAGGYSFEYPIDWMLSENIDSLAVLAYPDEYSIEGEDDLNTVYVYADKGIADGYTIDTLLQAWVDEIGAKGIENYEFIAQAVDTINGKDIASYSYAWTRGDYKLYNVDALLIDGSDLYVLELTVTQDNYEALYPLFEHMAISFEILK